MCVCVCVCACGWVGVWVGVCVYMCIMYVKIYLISCGGGARACCCTAAKWRNCVVVGAAARNAFISVAQCSESRRLATSPPSGITGSTPADDRHMRKHLGRK